MKKQTIEQAYAMAKERYADLGVDTDAALAKLQKISLSLHCWQADDVTGFENPDAQLSGGIQTTGNYPGKARNIEELRQDILTATSLISGRHRLSLHAMPISVRRAPSTATRCVPSTSPAGWTGPRPTA